MLIVPKEQVFQRWDTLTDDLREALFSQTNSDFIWKTCGDAHIPDEKIYAVSGITGYVLLGFLHPDDAAKEIEEAIGIDAKVATAIMVAIKKRIFDPLQKSIDDVYRPIGETVSAFKPSTVGGPVMFEEISMAAVPPKTTPQAPSSRVTEIPGIARASEALSTPSKFPIKSLNVEIPSAAVPVPAPAPVSTMPRIAQQILTGNPEIQGSLPQIKALEKKPVVPAPAPKPVILQEAASFETNKKSSEFHIETSENKLEGLSNIPRPMPQKAAVLELGSLQNAAAPLKKNEKTEASIIKPATGKYEGEFGGFASKTAPISEKGRTVTEITSSSQVVPKDLTAPAAPKPSEIKTPAPSKIPENDLLGEFAKPVEAPIKKEVVHSAFAQSYGVATPASIPAPAPAPLPWAATPAPMPNPSLPTPPSPLPVLEKKLERSVSDVMQFTAEKPARPIMVPTPAFTMPTPASKPSFFSKIFKKEPNKPTAVIEKNYSEADIVPEAPATPPTVPQKSGSQPPAPLPNIPVPPKKI